MIKVFYGILYNEGPALRFENGNNTLTLRLEKDEDGFQSAILDDVAIEFINQEANTNSVEIGI